MTEKTHPDKQRGWIIGGAIVLQVMLLIAVFALGVYIGHYGLTRDGLFYGAPGPGGPGGAANQPPRQGLGGPQPGAANQGGPPPLPPGLDEPPQLIGRLVASGPDALELATPQGPRSVLIDENTAYEDTEGNTFSLAGLSPGDVIAIYGTFSPDGRNLVATRVVILPPPPDNQIPGNTQP